MNLGYIKANNSALHEKFSEKLLQLVKEHPDYPVMVMCGMYASSCDNEWLVASIVGVEVGEILDCDTDWWSEERICSNREDFENAVCDKIWIKIWGKPQEELGRWNKEIDEAFQEIKKAHEPYWKKCIVIKVNN